ncbi:hypothetical protein H696_00472 [Fonticula alba]|uniref:Uncharacterized protein n=1 Tax=Fonticula alba TaxID=691883 RepID=A0A058ZHE5_FONAL|nr:hypothetical protein H696_00472 [Fonticula alba]KCV72902.1 hypothetical protein H696_00472 [Fonticula alba]|eukprot:XP_009492603.1 hypothetical protein H696_00472 [Fonticula alba]
MDPTLKSGEQLLVLGRYARSLLAAFHRARIQLNPESPQRPAVLSDPALQPLFRAMLRRFPSDGGLTSTQGADRFQKVCKDILDATGPTYNAFTRLVVFRDTMSNLLGEFSKLSYSALNGPDVVTALVSLMADYVRLHLLLAQIPDRRLITLIYARAFQITHRSAEPQFNRVAEMVGCDTPVARVQADAQVLSGTLALAIKQYSEGIFDWLSPSAFLRSEGVFNMIHHPAHIKRPSAEDARLRTLRNYRFVADNVAFAMLLTPSELVADPALGELLRSILEHNITFELFRCENIQLASEYEPIVRKMSSSNPAKSGLSDAISSATQLSSSFVNTATSFRRDRREFLRTALIQTSGLLADKPGLLGPKFSQVVSLLGLARNEILWYMRHLDFLAHNIKKGSKTEDMTDTNITEIMSYTEGLRRFILDHTDIVCSYYREYLAGYFAHRLKEVVAGLTVPLPSVVTTQLGNFKTTLASLAGLQGDALEAAIASMQMDWLRIQVFLSTPGQSAIVSSLEELVRLLADVNARMRYASPAGLDNYLGSVCGLHELLHQQRSLWASLEICTRSVAQSRHVRVYVDIIRTFPRTVVPGPGSLADTAWIGARTAELLERAYHDVSSRIQNALESVLNGHVRMAMLTMPDRAARVLIANTEKNRDSSKAPEEPLPGAESNFRLEGDLKPLHSRQYVLHHLCSAYRDFDDITVHDVTISPRQFLVDLFGQTFRNNVHNLVAIPQVTDESLIPLINRPSLLMTLLGAIIDVFQSLELYSGVPVGKLLEAELLAQTDPEVSRRLADAIPGGDFRNPFVSGKSASQKFPSVLVGNDTSAKHPLLFTYSTWYVDVVLNRLLPSGAIYSPSRRMFLSKPGAGIRLERYFDFNELVSLCTIIGAGGVSHIDQRLLRVVTQLSLSIKEYISRNRDPLEQIANWTNVVSLAEATRSFKNLDDIAARVMQIGTILAFRQLLLRALRTSLARDAPHLFSCVREAHSQYPANLFGIQGYLAIDILANAMGIVDNVDIPLRNALDGLTRDHALDHSIWSQLPNLFVALLPLFAATASLSTSGAGASAASSSSSDLGVTSFNPSLNAFDNNAGYLPLVLAKLLTATVSQTSASVADRETAIARSHLAFVETSAALLMHLASGAGSRTLISSPEDLNVHGQQIPVTTGSGAPSKTAREIDVMYILISQFAQLSTYVPADYVDEHIPYALVSSSVTECTRRQQRLLQQSVAGVGAGKRAIRVGEEEV